MVEIKLDQNGNTEYSGDNETINVEPSDFGPQNKFKKITYKIQYKKTYSSLILGWWWYSSYFYVYLKNDGQQIFEYRPTQEGYVVKSVEGYYAIKHPLIYLVIVFELKHDKRCFTYSNLKKQGYIKGYLTEQFDSRKLPQKLREEDNRVNRIKFLNTDGTQKNCHVQTERIDTDRNQLIKHSYTATTELTRYEDHELTRKELFSREHNIHVGDPIFKPVDNQYFDEVCVYCTNEITSRVLLLEFVNFNTGNKYFSRQDKYGYYWVQDKSVENVDQNKLTEIQTESDKKLSYFINKNDNYRGVTFTSYNLPSFKKDSHKPEGGSSTSYQTTFIFYETSTLDLEKNGDYKEAQKLTGFENKNFTEVCLYYWKFPQSNKPDYLKLKEKPQTGGGTTGSTNTYILKRSGETWTKWKQVENPGLDTVLTFLIEKMPKETESYNENSIEVTKKDHDSFNVYEHTPKTTHDGTKAYLLYNFNFLELETTKSEGTPKLDKIQVKCYQSVKTYYFKSIGTSYNSRIPIYIELKENETSTEYYLQRTDGLGLKWKQIETPNLENTITYLLERKDLGPYNNTVTVSKGNHVSFDVYIHKPTRDTSLGLLLYKSRFLELLSSKLSGTQQLDKLEWKNYECITVYCFKLSNNESAEIPTYLELKVKDNDRNSSKPYYLQRYTTSPIHWTQIKNPDLTNTITFLLNITENLYNDGSINVVEKIDPSFKIITHKPIGDHQSKKGILLFKDQDLQLLLNDLIEEKKRLNDFDNHIYSSVTLFYYKKDDEQLPAFLELQVKGTGSASEDQWECTNTFKCYLFQIADSVGITWKQIDYQDLSKTITFRLECKEIHKDGYEKSVTVKKTNQDSFDVYTHKSTKPDNLGLFLYKWHTLTLQPNDELPTGTAKLNKLHGKVYCKVNVYYYSSFTPPQPPLFLELLENKGDDNSCQSSDTTSFNTYWLQRVDPQGHHWMQKKTPNNLNDPGTIIQEINKNDKNSIMVQISQKIPYNMEVIKHYRNDNIGEMIKPFKTIFCHRNNLSNLNYNYYEHDLSRSSDIIRSNIERIRIYIRTVEIKMSNTGKREQKLNYKPSQDSIKKVYVYFYQGDNVPLMLGYNSKWYATTSKNDFFNKWTEKSGINSLIDYTNLKNKLDEINKKFNEILLHKTDNGYGIETSPDRKPPLDFILTRVRVTKEKPGGLFGKVAHTTVNNSNIGPIKFNEHDLRDNNEKKLIDQVFSDSAFTSATVTSVTAYYHKNDSIYTKPLLLGFAKSAGVRNAGNPEVFYERESVGDTGNWKKIEGPDELLPLKGGNQDAIAKRINSIHYNIGKSVMIQVDQQPREESGDSTNYKVQLVENKGSGGSGTGTTPAGGDQNITVSKNSCNNPSVIEYTCFTHQIPSLTGPDYVSGLKLYICDTIYLKTFEKGGSLPLPIYYQSGKNEVKVYFYQHGSSNNPPVDKVPLLVEYNGVHYKPSSRDGYFDKWVKTDVRRETEEARGDNLQPPKLSEVLTSVNKELNTIQLEKTGDSGNTNYGLKKPNPEPGKCCNVGSEEFCNRVTVQRDKIHKAHYLMVTHTTNNKGPIGPFKYSGSEVSGIKLEDDTTTCNKVEVYYLASDVKYETPLLICIISEVSGSISCTSKWYSRTGIDINSWNSADNNDGKFTGDSNIQRELEKIQTNLSNYLFLEIQSHKTYKACVQKGSKGSKQHIGDISVEKVLGIDNYKPENYRYYKHKLHEYYNSEKQNIQTKLELGSQGIDLTLQVSIYIDSIYINILGTNGEKLSTPLMYGNSESGLGTTNDPLVYFYDPETYGTDTTDWVPLLFKYGDRYFGPNSKEDYFKQWKQITITGGGSTQTTENIKKELDRINGELNEVDLSKKGGYGEREYGLEKPDDNTGLGPFRTQRITLKKEEKKGFNTQKYTTVTHHTVNGYNIGQIKALDSESKFDNNHTKQLKTQNQTHNEAVAVYNSTDARDLQGQTPQLVLICSSGRSGGGLTGGTSTVHGYYDLTNEGQSVKDCNSGSKKITFNQVTSDLKLEDITNRKKVQTNCPQLLGILENLGIVAQEHPPPPPPDPGLDSTRGRNGSDGLSGLRTDHDEGQDDRPKVNVPDADGLGGSGGKGAGAPGPTGPAGSKGALGSNTLEQQQQESQVQEQHVEEQQQESQVPEVQNGHGTQEQQRRGGDANSESAEGGGARPGKPGSSRGSDGETISAQSSEEGGFIATLKNLHEKQPVLLYGSGGGGVAGVGVMATVGAVA